MPRFKIRLIHVIVFLLYAAAGYLLYRGLLWAHLSAPLAQTCGTLYVLFFCWRTFRSHRDD